MILEFESTSPKLDPTVFIAPTAVIVGDVTIGARSSVWFGTVIRGDVHHIRIGSETNIQDNSTLHITGGSHPLAIGDGVTIGHRTMIHGCTIGNRVLIGMGAIVMDGAVVGDDSIVAAGSLVVEGSNFPPRSVIMGSPAKKVRDANERDFERITGSRYSYLTLATQYPPGTNQLPARYKMKT